MHPSIVRGVAKTGTGGAPLSAPRLRSTALLFVMLLMACDSGSAPPPSEPSPAPATSSAGVGLGGPPSEAQCRQVRECLHAKLAPGLDPTLGAAYSKAIDACLGQTASEIWRVARCTPIPLGKHPRNGRALELYVGCWDLCPTHAQARVRYLWSRGSDQSRLRSVITRTGRGRRIWSHARVTLDPAHARKFS